MIGVTLLVKGKSEKEEILAKNSATKRGKYELKRRAERQEETRQRIVEATVALHEALGVARTTISDIAARAGVERATVYRHFPDQRSLWTACIQHYTAANPPPDLTAWVRIGDPVDRLRTALTAIYAYYRRTEGMADRAARDVQELPLLRELLEPAKVYWEAVRELLVGGWPVPEELRVLVAAAIGDAITFGTWQSLVREQGLDDAQAIEAMVAMVRCLAGSGSGRSVAA